MTDVATPEALPGRFPPDGDVGPSGALARLELARDIIREVLADTPPEQVSGADAALLLERLVRIDRAVAAGRLAFANRAAECMTWREEGHPSAEAWLSQKTKTTVGQAASVLATARSLPKLPATAEALRSGELSLPQVREIAIAAGVEPAAETELIESAAFLSLKGLQNRARAVKLASQSDAERRAGVFRGRYFRHWWEDDGSFNIRARLTADAGVEILSAVKSRAAFVADEAGRARLEPEASQAYEADALHALVVGDDRRATFEGNVGGRTRSGTVIFHVDLAAYRRGSVLAGELCEVAGVGSVPIAIVDNVIGEAWLQLVIRDGVDVRSVTNLGRTLTRAQEIALLARDRVCCVPDCDNDTGLESHHCVPVSEGGPTDLANMARVCRFHHQLITYEGYRLVGGPGGWRWVAPGSAEEGGAGP